LRIVYSFVLSGAKNKKKIQKKREKKPPVLGTLGASLSILRLMQSAVWPASGRNTNQINLLLQLAK